MLHEQKKIVPLLFAVLVAGFLLICCKSQEEDFSLAKISAMLNEKDRELFEAKSHKLLIVFNSHDCISCLYIIGRIEKEIIEEGYPYSAVGIMPEDDGYSPEKLRRDSEISFPLIKYKGISSAHPLFELTPSVLLLDGNGKSIAKFTIYFDSAGRIQDKIIESLKSKDFLKKTPESRK